MESTSLGLAHSGVESFCRGGLNALHILLCKSENSSKALPHSCHSLYSWLYKSTAADKSTCHGQSLKRSSFCPQKQHKLCFTIILTSATLCLVYHVQKKIPTPVSLESKTYQAWCSVPTKQHNPIQAVLHKERVSLIVSTRWKFFFKKQD